MYFKRIIKITLLATLIILLSGCSIAGVKNKYNKSGPIEKSRSATEYKRTKVTIRNEQIPEDSITITGEQKTPQTLIIKKVGEKEYIITIKEMK